jgi:hypothetical protein
LRHEIIKAENDWRVLLSTLSRFSLHKKIYNEDCAFERSSIRWFYMERSSKGGHNCQWLKWGPYLLMARVLGPVQ